LPFLINVGTLIELHESSRAHADRKQMRLLAQRLLSLEALCPSDSVPNVHEALRVYEKMRISLTRFAGPDGFTALMRRALTLARADVPALQAAIVNADGSIQGLEEILADEGDSGREAAFALTGHLLKLLETFIGESLTLRLICDAWPNASLDE